jgi:CheY-like chemotaxis protein
MRRRFFDFAEQAGEGPLAFDLRKGGVARKITILLVEDDMNVRQALTQALTVEDFVVVAAANSDEALSGLTANTVDVLLIDQDLGQESGINTFAQLRTIQPGLPVILMSARSGRNTAFFAKGVNAVVEKPLLDLPLLFRALSELATEPRKYGAEAVHASFSQAQAGVLDQEAVTVRKWDKAQE